MIIKLSYSSYSKALTHLSLGNFTLSICSPAELKTKTHGKEHALNAIFSFESAAILKVNPEACSNFEVGMLNKSVLINRPS